MATLTTPDLATQLAHLSDRLATEYAALPRWLVRRTVSDVAAGFRGARVTQFVPILVEREVRRRLGPPTAGCP